MVIINNFIAKGVVRRLENIDDVDSFEEVFSDLVVLQDLIIKESNYEELSLDSQSQIQMLTSQIDNIQEILSFYENIDDMIDVMNELGE